MIIHESARQAAESAQGWTDIHDMWQYISTDFRWVIVIGVVALVGSFMGWNHD